jgi:hypothetical protein
LRCFPCCRRGVVHCRSSGPIECFRASLFFVRFGPVLLYLAFLLEEKKNTPCKRKEKNKIMGELLELNMSLYC